MVERLLMVVVVVGACAASTRAEVKQAPACGPEDGADVCKATCDNGSQESCAVLGVVLMQSGPGMHPDYPQAERLLQRACAANVALGCGGLGSLYGAVKNDPKRARPLLEKGCSMGDSLSCESLGGQESAAATAGMNPPRRADIAAAARKAHIYYRRACDLGSANGCGFSAAAIADKIVAGTLKEAFELYLKACGRGMAAACRLGIGLLRVDTAESKALAASLDVARLSADTLKRGCELGDAKSCAMTTPAQE
ncbi:MAG: sel1 repeat family protein [Myxococcales bacterium]|nr:sel1 repeat family protein [Myxococcales bacterium]